MTNYKNEDAVSSGNKIKNKTIWLIRHAQSTANRDCIIQGHLDAPLTEIGLQQAHLTGLYFAAMQKDFQVQNVFSSDLQRAFNTAKNIAEKLDLNVGIDERLREAFFGRWEGVYSADLLANEPTEYKKWMEDKTWRPHWCESFSSIQERAFLALRDISQLEGNTVIVTHGGILQALVYTLQQLLGKTKTEDTPRPTFFNCSISTLKKQDDEFFVQEVNFLAPQVPETKYKLADQFSVSK